MATTQHSDRVAVRPNTRGGKPVIAGARVAVIDVAIEHLELGRAVAEIAADRRLGTADVHAALAYYFEHRQEIDDRRRAGEADAESLREAHPSKL